MDKKEWNGKEAGFWRGFLLRLGLILGAIIIAVSVISAFMEDDPEPTYQQPADNVATAETTNTTEEPAPVTEKEPAIKTYAIGEDVTIGTIAVNVKGAKVTSEIHDEYTSKKTEDQFVVVSVKVTNTDVSARDFSANMFKLMDDKGVKYDPADASLTGYLYYETINPGLSRTYYVAFETPKGIKGLRLLADSGVAFAGGEYAMVNLGI